MVQMVVKLNNHDINLFVNNQSVTGGFHVKFKKLK